MFDFARGQEAPQARTIEDAPPAMRRQLVAALYQVAEAALLGARRINVDADLYPEITLMLGEQPVRVMHDAYAQRLGNHLGAAAWPMVFEVVRALYTHFNRAGRGAAYIAAVNDIFAMHGIAWDLGADGNLHRVLPQPAHAAIDTMFAELAAPRFAHARVLARAAQDHYDARPRRDRDACRNIFDAMEEAGRVALGLPGRGFGDVAAAIRDRNLSPGLYPVLDKLNGMAHQTFRHGNPVDLPPEVVDFVYVTCVGGILMFARLR